jgi:hypothetical protein
VGREAKKSGEREIESNGCMREMGTRFFWILEGGKGSKERRSRRKAKKSGEREIEKGARAGRREGGRRRCHAWPTPHPTPTATRCRPQAVRPPRWRPFFGGRARILAVESVGRRAFRRRADARGDVLCLAGCAPLVGVVVVVHGETRRPHRISDPEFAELQHCHNEKTAAEPTAAHFDVEPGRGRVPCSMDCESHVGRCTRRTARISSRFQRGAEGVARLPQRRPSAPQRATASMGSSSALSPISPS